MDAKRWDKNVMNKQRKKLFYIIPAQLRERERPLQEPQGWAPPGKGSRTSALVDGAETQREQNISGMFLACSKSWQKGTILKVSHG